MIRSTLFIAVLPIIACANVVEVAPQSDINFYPDRGTRMPANTAAQIDAAWRFLAVHANAPECGAPLTRRIADENRQELMLEIHNGYVPCNDSETGLCWGLSYPDAHFSELALTDDGIIHALPHEIFHHWLFWAHGDPDYAHSNPCWNTIESFSFTGNTF